MLRGGVVVGHVPQIISAACSAAVRFPIAAFSSAENFSYVSLTDLPLSFAELLHSSLAFSTSGSTTLFTTLIREEGIASDNGPVGSGSSDFGGISFRLKYLKRDITRT